MVKRNQWWTLALLALAQFVVVLDVTIVNVALPHIQRDVHFSNAGLQWVVSAYTLLFGGFLLLGGRMADVLGRRRMFMIGLALFTLASLGAGLSTSPTMMIAARAIQGLGGAMLSPAALSLLTVTFAHGRQRNLALGIWGALAGLGGTLGVVVGGVLIQAIDWRAVFFVNVPIGILVIASAPVLIAESRLGLAERAKGFDTAGAVLGTGGVLALVFGIVRTQTLGWGSVEVIAALAAAVALLVAFVVVELRAKAPLVPMRLFHPHGMRTSSLSLMLNGGAFLGMFFLTAIYLQEVRGHSALVTGIELLPMGVAAIIGAIAASTLVTRIGPRPVQITGTLLTVAGLYLLSRVGVGSSFATGLLPGFLLFGAGITAVGVPSQITAVAEIAHKDAGAASGVVTAAYQIGGAVGLAVITTISNSHVTHLIAHHVATPLALTSGYQRGLLIAAGLGLVNVIVALSSPKINPTPEIVATALAAA
jgi:EmrB/QacA subfamily drug resistance transporter